MTTDRQFSPQGQGDLRKRLVQDSFNYFLSKVVPGLMGLLSVVVFIRLVGYEQYGRYAVVLSLVIACSAGMSGWLSQGALRFQSSHLESEDVRVFERAVVTGTVLSVLVGGVSLGAALFFSGLQTNWTLLISIGLFAVLLIYTVILARFQASLRSSSVMRMEAIRSAAAFLMPVLLLWLVGTRYYYLLLLGILLGNLLPMFIYARFEPNLAQTLRLSSEPYARRRETPILRGLWQYGWPVALWYLCIQMLSVSDRYFIRLFSGYSGAGVYASMYDAVVRSFSLIFSPIALAVHPLVMNRWNAGDRGHVLSVIRTSLKYQIVIFIPTLLLLILLAPWVSYIILGKSDEAAVAIVPPLALGGFLWQISGLAHKPLEILCQTKRMLLGIVVALAVNVSGNYFLIPLFGYKAAAYLTIVSSLAYLLMLLVLTPMEAFRREIDSGEHATPAISSAEDLSGS